MKNLDMESLSNPSKMLRLSNSVCENISSNRVSAEEMDEKRQQNIAYEYLCHLEEAKK
jgi:hypothetical protein